MGSTGVATGPVTHNTPNVALSGEVKVLGSRAFVRLAATVVAVCLTGLAVFQIALVARAPLGARLGR
jgi:hypothetical protein